MCRQLGATNSQHISKSKPFFNHSILCYLGKRITLASIFITLTHKSHSRFLENLFHSKIFKQAFTTMHLIELDWFTLKLKRINQYFYIKKKRRKRVQCWKEAIMERDNKPSEEKNG